VSTASHPDREALFREFEKLSYFPFTGVGLALGTWAGMGDWASTGQAFRDRQGPKAITELDQLIERLREFRGRLAEHVTAKEPEEGGSHE
jgi:hypothetical protein